MLASSIVFEEVIRNTIGKIFCTTIINYLFKEHVFSLSVFFCFGNPRILSSSSRDEIRNCFALGFFRSGDYRFFAAFFSFVSFVRSYTYVLALVITQSELSADYSYYASR